jgi:hypothetical protein
MSERLPELLDAKTLRLELGVTRASAEAIVRRAPLHARGKAKLHSNGSETWQHRTTSRSRGHQAEAEHNHQAQGGPPDRGKADGPPTNKEDIMPKAKRSPLDQRPTLEQYVRHGEKFGVELVYETAAERRLSAVELGQLARHLRRLDRRWRLSHTDRHELAEQLVVAGVKAADVAEMAGVSRSTVASLRAASPRPADAAPQPTEPCGLVDTETRESASESTPTQTARFDAERAA